MPAEFLTDDEAAAYGRSAGAPSQADLERVFFLDDDDRALVGRHRGEHMPVALGAGDPARCYWLGGNRAYVRQSVSHSSAWRHDQPRRITRARKVSGLTSA